MENHFLSSWNLENLFAPEDFPYREPWLVKNLASELKGWDQPLFDTKIKQLASIIRQMNSAEGPDILGVCEVENAYVLQQLSGQLNCDLNLRAYAVIHADCQDQRGIDTAFLYDSRKYTVDANAIFSHTVMRRTGTRDITQVTFKTKGGHELVALCNHWPSRSGGTYESRGFRQTAGETLAYWHKKIWEKKGADVPIIAVGDFNDEPFDESLQLNACATRERGDVERATGAGGFYNLAWRYLQQQGVDHRGTAKIIYGTLYFSGNGNVFDQLLVSKGLLRNSPILVDESTARIEIFPEMVDHKVSEGPIRFGLPKGNAAQNVNTSGFSDHFPVSVVLREQ